MVGRATLSRSNESIAALVIAFFPRYPKSTTDNRYHLQALRHLYVLAVDYRVVNAVDIDTGATCLVPLRIKYKKDCRGKSIQNKKDIKDDNNKGQRVIAPCLLPESDRIEEITVDSPRHWYVRLSGKHVAKHLSNQGMRYLRQGLILYVKRKSGCLPYSEDPYGQRSLASRRRKTVSIYKRRRACNRVYGSTVIDISIPPPSFQPVSLSLSRISFYSKTPKQVFFNPIKYI